ncbi:MAG TPA: hypothetical protein VIJ22_05850 [Polyangiaceae bacterium]
MAPDGTLVWSFATEGPHGALVLRAPAIGCELNAVGIERVAMSTSAIVAKREGTGWHGTYVGDDGIPGELGIKLLHLVRSMGGDLPAVWAKLASAPDGWRHAFTEPYEPGFAERFATGRRAPPLLNDTDPFVQTDAAFWYIFDLESRELDVYAAAGGAWARIERLAFSPEGEPRPVAIEAATGDENRPRSMHVDVWAAAMDAAYADVDPAIVAATAARIEAVLGDGLPMEGRRTTLCVKVDAPRGMTSAGFVCPFILFVRAGKDPTVHTDIYEHPEYLLFPRFLMGDGERCEAALRSALARIALEIGLGKVPLRTVDRTEALCQALFPFRVVARKLDATAQDATIRAEVKKAFVLV